MVQSRCEHAVVADRKAFQIPQALAAAQNPEHRNQQQVPGRDANAPSHARIRSGEDHPTVVRVERAAKGT